MDATTTPNGASNVALNALSLTVARSILRSAHDFEVRIDDRALRFSAKQLEAQAWPEGHLAGLVEAQHGPWPSTVSIQCEWDNGQTTFELALDYWRRKTNYEGLLALRGDTTMAPIQLLWITLPMALRYRGGGTALLSGSFALAKRTKSGDEDSNASSSTAMRALAEKLRLPLVRESAIEVARVRTAGGEIVPSGEVAFERAATLCLLKLPFFDREHASIRGALPFAIPSVAGTVRQRPGRSSVGGKRGGIWPLPGGVRQYKETLDFLLQEISTNRLSVKSFYELLETRFDVTGATSRENYMNILTALELCVLQGGVLTLSDGGHRYLQDRSPVELFERLHRTYTGMVEIMAIADVLGSVGHEEGMTLMKALLAVDWQSPNQVNFRRNWLLSLGLSERNEEGDSLTERGRAVLVNHAAEADTIRARIAELVDAQKVVAPDDEEDEDEQPVPQPTPGLDDVRPTVRGKPPAWDEARVDLRAGRLAEQARVLALDPLVFARAAAALSAGKHLLLIGPPGTGKTELACAIADAARTEGYCAGAFVATASADWTTFDTIGGYALQQSGALQFRPGALLKAVEQWQWLVVDELNRADVDRAFGELMTVLAGRTTDTAYELADGRSVRIGPDPTASHPLPRTFRVLATMNTWDKTSLFRLSHAVQRRFAIIHVDVPPDDVYLSLLHKHADEQGVTPPLDGTVVSRLASLFTSAGLGQVRKIGPAIALDLIRYVRQRVSVGEVGAGDAIAEAIAMFVLPQLEGLDQKQGSTAFEAVSHALQDISSAAARRELRGHFAEALPHVALPR